jgi:hypothetical protein
MEPKTHYEGPHDGGKKVVRLVHAETYDKDKVIAAMPGGAEAGWWAPPVWKNTITTVFKDECLTVIDQQDFMKANPMLNKQNMLMWLIVREVQQ